MFIEPTDFNLFIALEVWTFDCSFQASGLVLLNFLQIVLDMTLSILAGMLNKLNHLVGEGISSIFEHWSSACWTFRQVHSAVLTNNVAHWTGGYGDLPGDQKTHWTLELLCDLIHFPSQLC